MTNRRVPAASSPSANGNADEQQARVQMLVGHIPAVLWSTDTEMRVTSPLGLGLNDLDLLPDQVVGMTLQEYFDTDDPEFPVIAAMRRALKGESVAYESIWQDRAYQSYVEPLRGANGEITGAISLALDMTERRKADLVLQESEASVQAIFESAHQAILLVNRDLTTKTFNRQAQATAMVMYGADLHPGESILKYVFPEDRDNWEGIMQAAFAGHPQSMRRELQGLNQTDWWKIYLDPAVLPGGEVHSISLVARNITDKVEAEQAREQAAQQERRRIARELHDTVTQALYGIGLAARTAREQIVTEPHKASEPLDYILSLVETGLAEMRSIIFELRPESLHTDGLVVTLAEQAALLCEAHGVEVSMGLNGEPPLSPHAKEQLFRIAREAIYNVIKHADARTVSLSMRYDADSVVLEVRDDGKGFDPTGPFPGHLGISIMRERATQLGGTLEISSEPGSGTLVRAQVPLATAH